LFLDIGRGPRSVDVARFVGLAGICAYELMQLPNFAPVCLIALSFFAFVALLGAKTSHERLAKLAHVPSQLNQGDSLGAKDERVYRH
jgi:hypothetical protein